MTHDHATLLAEILAQDWSTTDIDRDNAMINRAKQAGFHDAIELIQCCAMAKHGPDGKWQCWVTPQEFARILSERTGDDRA